MTSFGNVRILGDTKVLCVSGKKNVGFDKILTPSAFKFLSFLHQNFNGRRLNLLAERQKRQVTELDVGKFPSFLSSTKYIRQSEDWKVGPIPADLNDRRVEITGPVDRKMVINALNSGAKCYMADFEDSTAPTWFNQVDGQVNLYDAIRKQIEFVHPTTKKVYALNDSVATLLVRPRGWHLDEAHVMVDDQVMSGALFDFGMYFFHNAAELAKRNSGAYFYLAKLEGHLEARLWNDVFKASQAYLGLPNGGIRATVLIETILAVFEMDEILFELKEHSAGLNCGRWDYIFSYIKKFRNHPDFIVPDRSQVGMKTPFMDSYVKLLIRTCHRRGAFAMGGMAAQIPVKNNPELNDKFMSAVREDKLIEVKAGHDGTWVAHPALVKLAMDIFNKEMPTPNQIDKIPIAGANITSEMLIQAPKGTITLKGLTENIDVSLMYTEAWLRGSGCIPLNNKMEDAATAEISRGQVWQWIRHQCKAEDGTVVSKPLVLKLLQSCVVQRQSAAPKNNRFTLAGEILGNLLTGTEFIDFLTLPCYPYITSLAPRSSL